MTKLVLTAIGDDRPGLVAALSGALAEQGGNWLDSQMAKLAGKFAGIVLVEVPDNRRTALEEALGRLESEGLLSVSATPVAAPQETQAPPEEPEPAEGDQVTVKIMGNDRPGIMAEVTGVLSQHGFTIDDLKTSTRPAPQAEGLLFDAEVTGRVGQSGSIDEVRDALESLANDLMVEVEVSR